MEKRPRSGSLFYHLLVMSIVPIILLTMVITCFGATRFATSMDREVQNGMRVLCNMILMMFDREHPGAFHAIEQDGAIYLLKGEDYQLNGDFSIIDSVKEKANMDITIFYGATRVVTTIMDDNGRRAVGTRANAKVAKDVLENKRATFYANALIEGQKFFAYYVPLKAEDGTCIGMIFVGKPSEEVDKLVWKSVSPLFIVAFIVMIITGWVTICFARKLLFTVHEIRHFLEEVSGGNLHARLDPAVLRRTDELGEMGRHAVGMQKALRSLVETDILTGLNNRRSGEKLLSQAQKSSIKQGVDFHVAIGDIDDFKHVNDTYGHECGDVVLKEISKLMKESMLGKGFAARWGGEEFLLVFKGMDLDAASDVLSGFLGEVRKKEILFNDQIVKVTMTFGIVTGDAERLERIVSEADKKLYYGKSNGKNQLVK